jgi:predicted nucleic acid-binding protein
MVVADTGPLNYLVWIEAVDVLPPLYTSIVIPETVAAELRDPRTPPAVRNWVAQPPLWLNIAADPTPDETLSALDPCERVAIALACLLPATPLLIDDSNGRAEAQRRGLNLC